MILRDSQDKSESNCYVANAVGTRLTENKRLELAVFDKVGIMFGWCVQFDGLLAGSNKPVVIAHTSLDLHTAKSIRRYYKNHATYSNELTLFNGYLDRKDCESLVKSLMN